jgi:hypothetical protein
MGVELMDGIWLAMALGDGGVPGLFRGIVAGCHQARRYTGRDAGGAGRLIAARAGAAGGTGDLVAGQHQAA